MDDLIIGAPNADPNGNRNAGESYVVYGSDQGFPANLELSNLNGNYGFTLNGVDGWDKSGISVSGTGDVNSDGINDLIVGADTEESYFVFGSDQGFPANLNLSTLNGSNGFTLKGIGETDLSGRSVSGTGDVNGDGINDLIIGADSEDPDGIKDAGESYVVFGKEEGFPASVYVSTLDGSNGFTLRGIDKDDHSGTSVSDAGDINDDGFDDLIVGAYKADQPKEVRDPGESYVVYGREGGFPDNLDLSSLNGNNGFKLNGIDDYDESGRSVSSAGDINSDGIDDLIIGAENNDEGSYAVYGSASLGSPNERAINGTPAGDELVGTAGNDQIVGDQGSDLITSGGGSDDLVYKRLQDAGDTITDFEVGNDEIVLTDLLDGLNYGASVQFRMVTSSWVRVAQVLMCSSTRVVRPVIAASGHSSKSKGSPQQI